MRIFFSMKLLLFIFSVLLFTSIFAREKSLTGTVADDNGNVLSGATIHIKRSSATTASNSLGVFTLRAPANAKTLIISYIGMEPQEVSMGNNKVFEINLSQVANTLNDIVVIGYGTTKRANITSAISSISEKDIKNLPVASGRMVSFYEEHHVSVCIFLFICTRMIISPSLL